MPQVQAIPVRRCGRRGQEGDSSGGGGGANALQNTGDYKITVIIGGQSYSKTLRIERVSGGDGGGFGFGEDEERDEGIRGPGVRR
ncbi:MAG: hypothetical protein K2R93_17845 [Gemmatimonadaceae bacterium]|nr:hypothetical protein [Gemmatimonadaceae bacterium]